MGQLRYSVNPRQKGNQRRQVAKMRSIPAPTDGLVSSGRAAFGMSSSNEFSTTALKTCRTLDNLIPRRYGCEVRRGTSIVADDLLDASGQPGEVRTLFHYRGVLGGPTLFGATDAGIYRINGGGSPSELEMSWDSQGSVAGSCTALNYTDVGGTHRILVADRKDGYWARDDSFPGVWSRPEVTSDGTITIDDVLIQMTEYNNRLWFVEADSTKLWYLPPLQYTGTATDFDMGNRLPKGGRVVGVYSTSIQDAAGMHDYLCVVSEAGELLVWEGDPETNIRMIGRWMIGRPPEGDKIASDMGGTLVFITENGLIRLADVLNGGYEAGRGDFVSRAIGDLIRTEFAQRHNLTGWGIVVSHQEDLLMLLLPPRTDRADDQLQLVLSGDQGRWCRFSGIPAISGDSSALGLFFGSTDGKVRRYGGTIDAVGITSDPITQAPSIQSDGLPVSFKLHTHSSDMDMGPRNKIVQFLRDRWAGGYRPTVSIDVRFDFEELGNLTIPAEAAGIGALWGSAIWGVDQWGGVTAEPVYPDTIEGMGRYVSFVMAGSSRTGGVFQAWETMIQDGGYL